MHFVHWKKARWHFRMVMHDLNSKCTCTSVHVNSIWVKLHTAFMGKGTCETCMTCIFNTNNMPVSFSREIILHVYPCSSWTYPPESSCVFYGWVLKASHFWKNIFFEYVPQILHGNNIEPPISKNHIRMQIITSFAYCMHISKFLVFNIMY